MRRLTDGPLFTLAVFPEYGPQERHGNNENGSNRKVTDGGAYVVVDPIEYEVSDQYRQSDHDGEV